MDYSIHRPAGVLTAGVERGANIRSLDLGLPGNVCCRIYWDPTRYMTETKRQEASTLDAATSCAHEIATTDYAYSTSPVWNSLIESDEAKRLKQLLPNHSNDEYFEASSNDNAPLADFPVLQPFVKKNDETFSLIPWRKSKGAVVFEVKFQESLSLLPGSEYSMGEVVIPFSKLSRNSSISGWFKVLEPGTTRLVALGTSNDKMDLEVSQTEDGPLLHLSVKWSPPKSSLDAMERERDDEPSSPKLINETEREASLVIQEELIRAAMMNKDRKFGLVSTSLGAFNTVRGLSDNLLLVQNTLGSILDVIGSLRSAFNFTVSHLPFRHSFGHEYAALYF